MITTIYYERNFAIAPFIFEKIGVTATVGQHDSIEEVFNDGTQIS
jgi:hypothetical protein